jgi:hypothetical protein
MMIDNQNLKFHDSAADVDGARISYAVAPVSCLRSNCGPKLKIKPASAPQLGAWAEKYSNPFFPISQAEARDYWADYSIGIILTLFLTVAR